MRFVTETRTQRKQLVAIYIGWQANSYNTSKGRGRTRTSRTPREAAAVRKEVSRLPQSHHTHDTLTQPHSPHSRSPS